MGRSFQRLLPDETATERLGDDIAAALKPGDIVALEGDLGVGKTALARAIIRAMAEDPQLEVPSPTFTLVQSYDLRIPVHHFDLYRLTGVDELEELGLAEALIDGVALVEWPERAPGLVTRAIHVRLSEQDGGRSADIAAPEAEAERLARSFAIRNFLDAAGHAGAKRAHLIGDASTRAYEAVLSAKGEQFILMDAPERRDEPILRDGMPYSRIARLARSVAAFVAVANGLRDAGFSAPRIFEQDLERGLLLIEHLGTQTLVDGKGVPVPERYLAAARLLAAMHEHPWPHQFPVSNAASHALPPYDWGALGIETELMLDWYLPEMKGREATDPERQEFGRLWLKLVERLDVSEQSIVLRDYHSPNIIWRGERTGFDRLGLIDFQDAVIGPAAYDVASLALDARVTITEAFEKAVRDAYCDARTGSSFDRTAFEEAFAITAAQRNTKVLGIFVRLARRDGKPAYLRHLPRIRSYLERVFAHPALEEIAEFYRDIGIFEVEE
ncbi:tRNA (adenosine(37)-N6)-threonylcarbamoyltransferase complex ATPase subunit type 1 TsaE [Chelativorans sp. Marseille-P2723]|uniref:tRNA (adenosine(37)-N6)-threonylcarbamoyltransferase complex ATPase subunit type 1 TsaE n=1 Tax=Chelativorans sp. Marseille-P2723 TaxID=2709133 RepID=UPI0015709AD3|nr:tRNA (adenosine(37)-N6)-threonylcarbamoyltransferase complex ATPase subunit type 1 TsaE [Chelativorans sp. Marseille-P2723]